MITAGSTGMGLATAKRFVEEGMDHVFITGRRKDALDEAVAEIGKNVTGHGNRHDYSLHARRLGSIGRWGFPQWLGTSPS